MSKDKIEVVAKCPGSDSGGLKIESANYDIYICNGVKSTLMPMVTTSVVAGQPAWLQNVPQRAQQWIPEAVKSAPAWHEMTPSRERRLEALQALK